MEGLPIIIYFILIIVDGLFSEMHHMQPLGHSTNYSDPSDSTSGCRTYKPRGELQDKQLSTSDLMMAQLEPFLIKPGELPGPESFLWRRMINAAAYADSKPLEFHNQSRPPLSSSTPIIIVILLDIIDYYNLLYFGF